MNKVGCSIPDRFADPLFEVFDGGDFILSSWRDIEKTCTEISIYFENPADAPEAKRRLAQALAAVGLDTPVEESEIPDEDWRFSYRRHFKTREIGARLAVVPAWEADAAQTPGRERIVLDPGLAFGTGNHETTRACLEFIDGLAGEGGSFLDMGCGSGILSIAAAKLGFGPVRGFDIDKEAVAAAKENAALNGARVEYGVFALGRARRAGDGAADKADAFHPAPADVAAANILGPLLVKFAKEIDSLVRRDLIVSGILTEIYGETLAAFEALGWREAARKTEGEWTSGLLRRGAPQARRGI